jgi:hypothetical protein
MDATLTPPVATFYQVIDQAPMPRRADRAAGGTLPARAAQYCDAATQASAFGWWAYPPIALSLAWDGEQVHWTWPDHGAWLPLEAAQCPGLRPRYDAAAPGHLRGTAPPLLTALAEPGVVQVWTGLFARTAPGWSLLVRAPANLPPAPGYVAYEGIVEADRWFGPVFTNIRLTRTDMPVRLRPDVPFLQLQPLPRAAYAEATLAAMQTLSLGDFDWEAYEQSVAGPALRGDRATGQYAVAARRRRRGECPFAGLTSAEPAPVASVARPGTGNRPAGAGRALAPAIPAGPAG